MIFKQWRQVLEATKTQTRRLVKRGELSWHDGVCAPQDSYGQVDKVYGTDCRIKWAVGRTYAVKPGRGKKAVGRIRITKIRRERLGDITDADAEAEGIFLLHDPFGWTWTYQGKEELHYFGRPRWAYHDLWESIYGKGAWDRMKDDDVWVLELEMAKEVK